MEQLISDIEAYCAQRGISPQRFLREAINAKWSQWQSWKDRDSSPTMKVADRLREFMAADGGVHTSALGEVSPAIQPPPVTVANDRGTE